MKDTTMRDCSTYLSNDSDIPAPNGRVDDYTDRPHKLIYPS